MKTAVHITSVFVFCRSSLSVVKVKEYSGSPLYYINLVSDHRLTSLSTASVRDMLILGISRSLILQVLIVIRNT